MANGKLLRQTHPLGCEGDQDPFRGAAKRVIEGRAAEAPSPAGKRSREHSRRPPAHRAGLASATGLAKTIPQDRERCMPLLSLGAWPAPKRPAAVLRPARLRQDAHRGGHRRRTRAAALPSCDRQRRLLLLGETAANLKDAAHADVERVVRRAIKEMVLQGDRRSLGLDHLDTARRRERAQTRIAG